MLLKLLLILNVIFLARADDRNNQYANGEEVILWANKVGPFRNPQETYLFYDLPFCPPSEVVESRIEGLGEALMGYELRKSAMEFVFKENVPQKTVCTKELKSKDAELFRHAVQNQYWYQLFFDDLPMWGMVGEVVASSVSENKPFIYTYMKFMATYNGDRVIGVNLTAENPMPIETGIKLDFTYSMEWFSTDTVFDDRFEKYLDNNFFEHQIHWFSIFNSFMMVIFLTGLVFMILMRTLNKDYAKYSKEDEDLLDEEKDIEESGWKQVHGDVFRAPPQLMWFSALVGTGHQLVILVFAVILFSILGTYYKNRGTVVTAFIICYAFTSFVAGYGGGGFYARNGGKHWIKAMVFTAALFPGVCFTFAFLLNFIAVGYGSLAAIPFFTMVAVVLIWGFISFPLTLVGTVVGKNWNGKSDNPCRISPVPKRIPEKNWYLQPWVNIILGGILPFGSIFIEMYFIFTSFWHYKYYYVYGFMLLVFIILIIVTICVTIVSTYFLLNSEDYRWQWTSFLSAASTSGYVFLYAIYYFFLKTKMSGFFQTCFYFGYMFMFCFGLGIMCGAIGFIGTSIFVRRIYKNVKID